jgi:hypothetical protein
MGDDVESMQKNRGVKKWDRVKKKFVMEHPDSTKKVLSHNFLH